MVSKIDRRRRDHQTRPRVRRGKLFNYWVRMRINACMRNSIWTRRLTAEKVIHIKRIKTTGKELAPNWTKVLWNTAQTKKDTVRIKKEAPTRAIRTIVAVWSMNKVSSLFWVLRKLFSRRGSEWSILIPRKLDFWISTRSNLAENCRANAIHI